MKRNKKCLFILAIMLMMVFSLVGCKKQRGSGIVVHPGGHELNGAPPTPRNGFGVQTTKATESNPVHVHVAYIYVPTGRNEKGICQYKTVDREMEELTPENLNQALIDCGVLTNECGFISFTKTKAKKPEEEITPNGIIRREYDGELMYIEVDSLLLNEEEYLAQNKKTPEQQVGMIAYEDIIKAVLDTFKDEFQLAESGLTFGNEEDYKKAHGE